MPIKLPFGSRGRELPKDLWTKCPGCEELLYNKRLAGDLWVCSRCGHHFRVRAQARLALLVDADSFRERDAGLESVDPLEFVDTKPYPERLATAQAATGLRDAAVWGTATIGGIRIAICVMDFGFMGGSMGSVVGEKVTRAAEAALAERIPLVTVAASGGARMQEGTLALMQLAKTCAALERLAQAGVPYISLMTDPTTGGVFASFAALGDVNLAEPGALIGFAGARVAAGTIAEELPPGFQRAEFLLEHGFVDRIVPRARLRDELVLFLRLLRPLDLARLEHMVDGTARVPVLGAMADGANALATAIVGSQGGDRGNGAAKARAQSAAMAAAQPDVRTTRAPLPERQSEEEVWERVLLARDPARPHTRELAQAIGTDFIELHGDRLFRDDPAIVAGLFRVGGRAAVIVGHQKGSDTTENIRRNFGMPHPEGYRKAQRLFALAERFGLPVVTTIDTPGAFPGPASEERGVAEAIARSIMQMSALRTPVVAVLTGEGGSGGALAIAVGDTVLALENAIYSVISPEGCASILWRSPERARTAAAAMRITAPEQVLLGVVDEVVPEPAGGAQRDPAVTGRRLREAIAGQLERLSAAPVDELLAARYRRYRDLGAYRTVEGVAGVHVPDRPSLAGRLRQLLDAGVGRIGGPAEAVSGARSAGSQADEAAYDAPLREDV
jgi:acetyl-CoA carboxylase carboxyl transferase beta subunit/acetyl-CoA carboxylase carboxyl transferase alpha subunit